MADLTLNGTDTDTNLTLDLNNLPYYNPDVVPNSVPSPVGNLTLNLSSATTSIWDSVKKYWWLILALVIILYFMFRKGR